MILLKISNEIKFYLMYILYRMKLLKISNQVFFYQTHFILSHETLELSNHIFLHRIELINCYRILLPMGSHKGPDFQIFVTSSNKAWGAKDGNFDFFKNICFIYLSTGNFMLIKWSFGTYVCKWTGKKLYAVKVSDKLLTSEFWTRLTS